MGAALPIICAVFLAYGLFGQYLPAPLDHRGYDFDQIVDQMFLGTEGIYGIPTYVSSTYIFLFILFGAFLEHAGMIQLFNDVALGLVGHARGGPAKVAVISSGLMGTINGSGVANVRDRRPVHHPADEALRLLGRSSPARSRRPPSMGGQIMPPVMGAVAFIMAETHQRALRRRSSRRRSIPALLYYRHRVLDGASRGRPRGLRRPAEGPSARARRGAAAATGTCCCRWRCWSCCCSHGYTPLFAGIVGLALTAILILGAADRRGAVGRRRSAIVFWIAARPRGGGLLRSTASGRAGR